MKPTLSIIREVLESLKIGFFLVAPNGVISYLDKTCRVLLGAKQTDWRDEHWSQVVPWLSVLETALVSKQPFYLQYCLSTQLYVEGHPIHKHGRFQGILCSIHENGTIHNSAEIDHLKSTIEELNEIIEFSYDGISVMNSQGIIMRVNNAYEKATGFKATDVIGKRGRDLIKDGFLLTSSTERALIEKKSCTVMNKTNSGKYLLSTSNPIFDAEGNLIRIIANVRDIMELVELKQKYQSLTLLYERQMQKHINEESHFDDVIMSSRSMKNVLEAVNKVARVESNVLIQGESGTGKEIIAELIHSFSDRNKKQFIKINCGAIPDTLLESELFGYEKGAFTGASSQGKVGIFELADGGTLFLDEISEIPWNLQAKLLRAIQNREIIRIGGTKPINLNVRFVVATNRDLEKMVAEKLFREDLYYRLNVIPINLPPLRERLEDIPLLINKFIEKFNKMYQKTKKMDYEAIEKLTEYNWPGNVRELKNVVENMVVMSDVDMITVDDIPPKIKSRCIKASLSKNISLKTNLNEYEKSLIMSAVKRNKSIRKAAQELMIDHATLLRKIKRYKIDCLLND